MPKIKPKQDYTSKQCDFSSNESSAFSTGYQGASSVATTEPSVTYTQPPSQASTASDNSVSLADTLTSADVGSPLQASTASDNSVSLADTLTSADVGSPLQASTAQNATSQVYGIHENSAEIIEKAQKGDDEALSLIIETNSGLVKSIALRFRDRGVELEDIIQIGTMGMIKAVRNFDFSFGTKFSTYAVPLIMGEIKKFLRDDGLIKVSRETKRRAVLLLRERERITNETGAEPTIGALASILGITPEEAAEALESATEALSFSDTVGETPVENFVGEDSTPEIIERLALRQAIETLPEEERKLIEYRYYKGFSQSKTALIFGVTQVKISRTEKKIIEKLKKELM